MEQAQQRKHPDPPDLVSVPEREFWELPRPVLFRLFRCAGFSTCEMKFIWRRQPLRTVEVV